MNLDEDQVPNFKVDYITKANEMIEIFEKYNFSVEDF